MEEGKKPGLPKLSGGPISPSPSLLPVVHLALYATPRIVKVNQLETPNVMWEGPMVQMSVNQDLSLEREDCGREHWSRQGATGVRF